ncbi:MAG: hypothetical protein K0R72_1164 [Clostridia bacterium]|jgi:Tfp pilus assembly protein PilE|nr:hypothetical protein [Clostridia bacterium]
MNNGNEKYLYKATNKKGISLIVLIITIIVALILVATVTVSTLSAIDDANITTFSKNLAEIQDSTESYYLTNNVMPLVADSTALTKDELLAIARSQDVLLEEITDNNDLNSQFYKIDLAKINVTKIPYGNGDLGAGDIFVVAYPSMHAYYPYGLQAKGQIYFSITSKISNVVQIYGEQTDKSSTVVTTSGGIKLTKINGWANKMGVSIEAEMAADEFLYMSVSGDANRLITTIVGKNTFGFNLLSSIVSDSETIKVPTLTLAEANYIELGTKPLIERYVDILKYKGSEVIGKVRIDLSNFSRTLPTITSATISSYSSINTVKINLSSSESGIKEVRYEYLTKYTDNATIENYYNGITDFDTAYMLSKAKSAKVTSDLTTTINAAKNVRSIKIAVIDKAGNVNLYNQEIAPRLYIGYTLDNSTKESVQLTAKMFSVNGIKSIAFSKSIDGVTFTDEQVYTLNTTTNGITTKQNTPFTNFTADNTFVKMVAVNYDNTITETRIVSVNLNYIKANAPGTETNPGIALPQNSTITGKMPTYNNPVIPAGFVAINTAEANWNNVSADWNNGLVIQDTSGNQFVWVPVDGTSVPYAKWCTTGVAYNNANISNDTLPAAITNEANQITKYKGFYIARYEAMFDYNSGNIRVASKKSANKISSSWVRGTTYTGYLFNFINYADSKTYSQNMAANYGYDPTKVITNLVTGTQWDSLMKWIQNSGINITNSGNWGNYSNSISPANIVGFGTLQVSGFSDYWKAKNIYDLAGNTWEWTNEMYTTGYYMLRGGSYTDVSSTYCASNRLNYAATTSQDNISFRPALYIF